MNTKVAQLADSLESQYKVQVSLVYRPDSNTIKVDSIFVPKSDRSIGIGTKVMERIAEFAEDHNATVVLTPATDFGATSVARLRRFYGRFGFVRNLGRHKDFTVSETMIRKPKKADKTITSSTPKLVDFQKLPASKQNVTILESLVNLEEETLLDTGGQDAQIGYVEGDEVVAAIWCEDGGGYFTIATRPDKQGSGLARKLLEKFIAQSRQKGWERLLAIPIHPAMDHLVKELGFTPRSEGEWSLYLGKTSPF